MTAPTSGRDNAGDLSSDDAALEAAIDRIGRERVFSRARAFGWRDDAAPKWVWWGIVAELQATYAARGSPVANSPRNEAGMVHEIHDSGAPAFPRHRSSFGRESR